MLNEEQLKALMAELESDTAERTESTNNTDKFGQAICAFANDLPNRRRPGYLLVGVKDDGSLAGIKVTDDLLKNLAGIRSDGNLLPQPMMSVAKFSAPPIRLPFTKTIGNVGQPVHIFSALRLYQVLK